MTEEVSAFDTPEWKAFARGCERVYLHIRNVLGKLGQQAWRPYFNWGMSTCLILAFLVAFVLLPKEHYTLPAYYYTSLLTAFGLMLAALGLRTAEKVIMNQQAIEQTRRIEQP